jgi:hypothetical protein
MDSGYKDGSEREHGDFARRVTDSTATQKIALTEGTSQTR